MHTRGRYGASSLAVSPDGPPPEPPQPPSFFNEREIAEWNALVRHLGADFFPWESLALLKELRVGHLPVGGDHAGIVAVQGRTAARCQAKRVRRADAIPGSVGHAIDGASDQATARSELQ